MSNSATKINGRGLYEEFNPSFGDDRAELRNWLIMDTWDYEAAIWLLAGVIPTQVYEGFGFHKFEGGLLGDEKSDRIAQINSMTRLWLSNPTHPKKASPQFYFDWAERKGIYIYWLAAAKEWGHFKEGSVNQKQDHSDGEVEPHIAVPSDIRSYEDKPLKTYERKTLLTIIAALAKEAKISITVSNTGKAAGFIEGLTAELGARVSKRAIEEHLKRIPDALETRMK